LDSAIDQRRLNSAISGDGLSKSNPAGDGFLLKVGKNCGDLFRPRKVQRGAHRCVIPVITTGDGGRARRAFRPRSTPLASGCMRS
jgi:hypothetical protein